LTNIFFLGVPNARIDYMVERPRLVRGRSRFRTPVPRRWDSSEKNVLLQFVGTLVVQAFAANAARNYINGRGFESRPERKYG